MTTTYTVSYRGFLQDVERTFETRERAEQWCRQIGRAELIPTIEPVRLTDIDPAYEQARADQTDDAESDPTGLFRWEAKHRADLIPSVEGVRADRRADA